MTMPIYITLAGLKAYLETVYPAPPSISDNDLTRMLSTAYGQLYGVYALGDAPQDTAAAACYAQAYFVFTDGAAARKRAGLQAQGVVSAGVVQETYSGKGGGIAIAPEVRDLLKDYGGAAVTLVQRTREPYEQPY